MKKIMLFRLALMGLVTVALCNVKAGSAVVSDGARNLTTSYGHPVEIAKERALETAHRLGWSNVRILAWTDQSGYGAIAIAVHPNGYGSLIGVALGRHSLIEAEARAIELCVKAGGTNAKIKSTFRG
jgi:hypothetical protein